MAHKGSINEEKTSRDIGRYSSTLEDVDFAVYKFFDERLELKTKTNKGFRKTPIIWAGSERAHNIKNDKTADPSAKAIVPALNIDVCK